MPYEEIFEIIENREWENEENFGADLLDLIRRRKRVKRAIVGESISMTTTRIHTLKPRYNKLWYSEFCNIVNKIQLPFWQFTNHITFDIVIYSI